MSSEVSASDRRETRGGCGFTALAARYFAAASGGASAGRSVRGGMATLPLRARRQLGQHADQSLDLQSGGLQHQPADRGRRVAVVRAGRLRRAGRLHLRRAGGRRRVAGAGSRQRRCCFRPRRVSARRSGRQAEGILHGDRHARLRRAGGPAAQQHGRRHQGPDGSARHPFDRPRSHDVVFRGDDHLAADDGIGLRALGAADLSRRRS